MWIGYEHPDRLLSYPDVRFLSGCWFPIRMFVTYPDADFPSARIHGDAACRLSECAGEPSVCLWAGSLDRRAVRLASGSCCAACQAGSSAQRSASGGLARVPTIRATMHGSLTMSHVIPRRLFQTLKMCRWNCNVCGASRKLTDINYVRLLRGGGEGRGKWGSDQCEPRPRQASAARAEAPATVADHVRQQKRPQPSQTTRAPATRAPTPPGQEKPATASSRRKTPTRPPPPTRNE